MTDATEAGSAARTAPKVKPIYMDRPWAWLAAGWRDMCRAPMVSLPYGALFAVVGIVLTVLVWNFEVYYLTFPLMAGFLLIGPILAVGLYEISRCLAAGEPVTLRRSLTAWRRNGTQIAFMGVVLLLINIAWVRLASIIFFGFFSGNPPPVDPWGFMNHVLSTEAIPFLIVGNLVGLGLAAFTFAVSAFSFPLLLDRDVNVMTAIATSWTAVTQNVRAMALWAWLIVLFVAVGIATFYIGLIITLPLIGHATWAAYKDVVE